MIFLNVDFTRFGKTFFNPQFQVWNKTISALQRPWLASVPVDTRAIPSGWGSQEGMLIDWFCDRGQSSDLRPQVNYRCKSGPIITRLVSPFKFTLPKILHTEDAQNIKLVAAWLKKCTAGGSFHPVKLQDIMSSRSIDYYSGGILLLLHTKYNIARGSLGSSGVVYICVLGPELHWGQYQPGLHPLYTVLASGHYTTHYTAVHWPLHHTLHCSRLT